MPHADEALRTLFVRFKEDPSSPVFGELSEALLVRGHAQEALRVAEHGLQLRPKSAEGRVHRAASLLALARPKVAYVELLRALAIDPRHTKALRLLGKVYVDAGSPERAAALLRRRHAAAVPLPKPQRAPSSVEIEATQEVPIEEILRPKTPVPMGIPPSSTDPGDQSNIPELFASLTHDLGLDLGLGPVPNDFAGAQSRVEVTQVIRARLKPRRELHEDELTSIDGPIVDTATQPDTLEIDFGPSGHTPPPTRKPRSVLDVATSPGFHLTYDEESASFIKPISDDDETINDSETLNDGLPSRLDLEVLRRAIEDGSPKTDMAPVPTLPQIQEPEQKNPFGSMEDTSQNYLPAPDLPYLKRYSRQGSNSATTPAQEIDSLRLEKTPTDWGRALLMTVGGLVLTVFVLGLLLLGKEDLKTWIATSKKPTPTQPSP